MNQRKIEDNLSNIIIYKKKRRLKISIDMNGDLYSKKINESFLTNKPWFS